MDKKKEKIGKKERKKTLQNTNMDYVMFLYFKFSGCCAMLIIRNSSLNCCAFLWGYTEPVFTFSCHLSNFSFIQEGLCQQPQGRTNSASVPKLSR